MNTHNSIEVIILVPGDISVPLYNWIFHAKPIT